MFSLILAVHTLCLEQLCCLLSSDFMYTCGMTYYLMICLWQTISVGQNDTSLRAISSNGQIDSRLGAIWSNKPCLPPPPDTLRNCNGKQGPIKIEN